MNAALGQLPDQPCLNGTEQELTLLGSFSYTLYVIEDPLYLRSGEVRVDDETGLLSELVGEALLLQAVTVLGGSAALPYDRMIYRLAGRLIPYDGGLSLVGDTNTCDILCGCTDLVDRLDGYTEHARPDLLCIMLYPARLREVLCELTLCYAAHLTLLVEQDTPVTRRSRIQRHYILSHTFFLLCSMFLHVFHHAP